MKQLFASRKKRFLSVLLAIALPIGLYFGIEDYRVVSRLKEVAKAPAFAPAQFEEVIKERSFSGTKFRVRFGYVVDGKKFHVITSQTDQKGVIQYVSSPNTHVAYSSRDPEVGVLKRYYDLRRPGETVAQAMFVVALLALIIALPIAILFELVFWLVARAKK